MSADAAHLSIGEVLEALREEFPDVTISKIRFLEGQGLIDPERTPSGYRKFYPADVARLRWILLQQKENFLPLKVIKGRLEQLELGDGALGVAEPAPPAAAPAPAAPAPAPVEPGTARPGRRRRTPKSPPVVLDTAEGDDLDAPGSAGVLTRAELGRAAGIDEATVGELESFGLLTPATEADGRVLFDEEALEVARAAAGFAARGIGARHLRMYRAFAEREAGLFEQALVGVLRQRSPEARGEARAALVELAALGRRLRAAYLRQAVQPALDE